MKYCRTHLLKDGRECCIRSGTKADGERALANFRLAHEQTDFLLSYPEELVLTPAEEGELLERAAESENTAELLAEVECAIAGLAGVHPVGEKEKLRHRAELGISLDSSFWGLGIGRALLDACIECAERGRYTQLELGVVSDNSRAIELYRKAGFTEYGRNPKGFLMRTGEYQELVLMRRDLSVSGG